MSSSHLSSSHFTSVELLPVDPIFGLPILFAEDKNPNKVNLGIGAYRDAAGKPLVLSCVKKAEKLILEKNANKEYLPIEGAASFISASLKLIFGDALYTQVKERLFGAQTVGGTNALRIAGDFLSRNGMRNIYFPEFTWPNHRLIFSYANMQIATYPYYDQQHHTLNFSGMCKAIQHMPPGSIVLLHACCHNPTGVDPSQNQWKELSELIKAKNLIPLFDLAYQGFGTDLQQDAFSVRYFAEQGHELFIASSYAKNLGLYGERVGALAVITHEENHTKKVASQLKQLIRSSYSNPPLHGEQIVTTILESKNLSEEWETELSEMRKRIIDMRIALSTGLKKAGISQEMSFLETQKGIFSFLGITKEQVHLLRNQYGIYLPDNGRINMAGLTYQNMNYVVEAIVALMGTYET